MIYQPPIDPYLDVVYQDQNVLVLNKPSGLLSVPGRQAIHKDSLQSRVQEQFPHATTVHRLDMETSGLIVMALNKPTHVHLGRQFEHRLIKKQYRARVFGHPAQTAGKVEEPLICDWPNRPRQIVDHQHGKPALTHWRVLAEEAKTALIELVPVTGRSHQLRVHMMAMGHPIVGDPLYAVGEALTCAERLALQSQLIEFQATEDGAMMCFQLPSDF